jgi:hypothetical protein
MAAYATTTEADAYFDTRLHSQLWEGASPSDKTKALAQATRAIDRLRFIGQRHSVYLTIQNGNTDSVAIAQAVAEQPLEFPRDADEEVPEDIKIACYEEAFTLLDGKDPDAELEDLPVVSQGYSSVRVTVDRSFVQEHLNAGIVSPRAWRYLKPYIAEAREVRLNRV